MGACACIKLQETEPHTPPLLTKSLTTPLPIISNQKSEYIPSAKSCEEMNQILDESDYSQTMTISLATLRHIENEDSANVE
ncbi:hypothetical protein SS50377_21930 [Spironucleus salmonicida]|uniref:Uncharacterized protein n=1 Tax=Spironucleus salmonicida TaxID=348837 RepID=A0A9P8S167_9EUKA|nr:hypothetical protein SS50377_21930 [Spironucleus salmonicida]